MGIRARIRKALAGAWLPLGSAALIAYFAVHAVRGEHGLIARARLAEQVRTARATLDTLTAERAWMQRRADLLGNTHIDPDMLDEQVRTTMNYVHPDDVILYLKPPEAPAGP